MIRSVSGAEQGPTAEQQAYFFPRAGLLNQLGDPQDPTRVTFPFLKRMRRDHMVAMGLHYIATPIVSASYYFDCLAGDTRIAMADGSYKALEDIKPGDVILSSGGQSVTYDIVTATMMKGYREIVEVTLDDNRTLRCTPEHKIYGWDEWVEAKDLLPGDPVCVSGKHPDYPRQSENPDDAWLIGLWLAEGSKNHGSFMITCGTPGVRERLQEIADRRGWKLHCYSRIPIQMTLSAGRKKLGDTPNNLLRAFGVKGMTTKTISIPERIFKGDDETVGAFLSGYIAGDGCCNGERQLWSSSISRQMSKDIQLLVSRLGVRSNVYWHEHKTEFGHQPTWIWSVGDRKSLVKLASFLDVTGKQQQLEDLISRCTDGGGAARDSSIPLRYRMELKGSKTPVMTEKVRRTWRDSERALADAQRTGNTELEFKITNGLQWRKVKSVKSAGFEQVYDISTSATHAFFTEAGLVHNCENAQVAAFADNIIRPIYGRLTLVILRMLWAGYSPAAKNFETVNPNWTYLPGIDEDPLPVWDQGSVQALVYKPVTPLRPEVCRPVWDANGNFNGIGYDGRYGGPGYFTLNGQRTPDVDAAHAVWSVHDQDSESGSPWGFARVAYCAPIFHMYRYIWTLLGRAFENNADPGPVVRYPREDVPQVDADGNAVRNVDVALRIGRRRRSGSTVALPSESYVDLQDKPTGVQKWAIEYPKNETSFAEILKFIEFLEASKLRSLLISEQGLITSSGAQSNRNTMASASQQRNESQLVLMKQIIDVIEQVFVAPAIAMNMPWFEGNLSMRTVGFGDQEDDVVKQILQLEGQLDPRTFGVDVKRILASRGLPMYSAADYKKVEAQIAADPPQLPAVKPTEGRRALVTQTGFDRETGKPEMSYVQLGGRIELSDDGDFVASLPRTDAFADAKVLAVARSLRSTSSGFLSWLYGDFARYLGKQKNLDLTEVLEQVAEEHLSGFGVELAGADGVRAVVDRIMAGWRPSVDRIAAYSKAARTALGRVVDRTASLQLSRVGSKASASSLDEVAAAWLDDRGAELVSGVLDTTRKQIAEVLADGVRAGQTTTQIAADLRAHFSDFPVNRARLIATVEIPTAFNYATVQAGQSAGIAKAQLVDGHYDSFCSARDGRIVSLADAAKERLAHPGCHLCVRLLPNAPTNLEVRREPLDGLMARYDPGSETVLLSPDISQEDESRYLIALGDSFAAPASQD